jgi:PAS domain S-box-containing protein
VDETRREDDVGRDPHAFEEALREREAFIRTIGDNFPDGLIYQVVVGKHGGRRFTYVSDSVRRLHGCTPAEALADARRIYDTLHPEDRSRLVREEEQAIASLSVFRTEVRVVDPDGSVRWATFASKPRSLPDGSTCWDGVELDITERKRAEEALRLSEESHRAASRLMSELIVRIDVDAAGRARTALASDGLLRATGRTLEEVRDPAQWLLLIHPDDRAGTEAALARLVSQGGRADVEGRIRLVDGSWRVVRILAEAVRDETAGRTTAVLVVISDVTARRQAEREAKDVRDRLVAVNEELEATLRLKDEFLSSMSHELRTPLNAILGFLQSIRDEVYGGPEAKLLRAAGIAEEAGRHLLELISDVLDLSKVQAGLLALELGPVSVRALCEASLRMVEKAAERKRIRLALDLEPGAGSIVADGRRLKQVVVNLLSNAVKFTPEGGHVRLAAAGDPTQGVLTLSVSDDGIGIPEEKLPRLFRPFTQVESGLSRQQPGTGLGLSLVLGLTKLHGGGVEVRSRPGEGSTFFVRLPWRSGPGVEGGPAAGQGRVATPPQEPRAAGPVPRGRVLVVEDNEANALVLSEYLAHAGFDAFVARGGPEALRIARETPPDVVLMDVQMPGMDGLETTRRLRSEETGAEVPILAVTALAMPGDRERCLAAGANDYLTKPLDLPELVRRIGAVLGGPDGRRHAREG